MKGQRCNIGPGEGPDREPDPHTARDVTLKGS